MYGGTAHRSARMDSLPIALNLSLKQFYGSVYGFECLPDELNSRSGGVHGVSNPNCRLSLFPSCHATGE